MLLHSQSGFSHISALALPSLLQEPPRFPCSRVCVHQNPTAARSWGKKLFSRLSHSHPAPFCTHLRAPTTSSNTHGAPQKPAIPSWLSTEKTSTSCLHQSRQARTVNTAVMALSRCLSRVYMARCVTGGKWVSLCMPNTTDLKNLGFERN